MRTSSGVMSSRPEICWLVDQLPPLPVVLPCVSRSMVSLPRSSLTYLWVDCSLPPRYKNSSQLPTMDSHCLSNSARSCAMFWMMIDADTPRPRMVESIFSKSLGKLTLANSSMRKCTCTGSCPPCFPSASAKSCWNSCV